MSENTPTSMMRKCGIGAYVRCYRDYTTCKVTAIYIDMQTGKTMVVLRDINRDKVKGCQDETVSAEAILNLYNCIAE